MDFRSGNAISLLMMVMQKLEKKKLNRRRFPILALDSHDGGLLVREANLTFFIEARFLEVINESGIGLA